MIVAFQTADCVLVYDIGSAQTKPVIIPFEKNLIDDGFCVIRVSRKRRFPAFLRVVFLPQIQERKRAVIQVLGGIRVSGKAGIRVFPAGDLAVQRDQVFFNAIKAVRSVRQAGLQKSLQLIGHGMGALCGILVKMIFRFRAGRPEEFTGIHFENGQRPRINIHPAGRLFPVFLFGRTVWKRVAADFNCPRSLAQS